MIALRNLTKTFALNGASAVTAVREVTLTIERGEFVVITGRSGSGKTTLLNLAAGLTRPSAGEVTFEGTNLWELPDRERSRFRNRTMGFIFQFPSLLPSLTVLENVLLATTFWSNHDSGQWGQRAAGLLETQVSPGLSRVHRPVNTVSDGDIAPDEGFAGPDPDDVGVAGGDGNRADRLDIEPIEDGKPMNPAVGRFEHAPRGRPRIDGIRIAGNAGYGDDPVSLRADVPVLK